MTTRFLLDVTYSDDELAAYGRITDAEWLRGTQNLTFALYATGFFASLLGAFFAIWAGATSANRANLIAVLIFAGFFVGLWSPSMWCWRRRRDAARTLASRSSLLVTESGLWVRRAGARGFYSRSAMVRASVAGGLLLIWLREGRPQAIPLRLLDDAQKARLLALAPAGRS